MYVSILWLGSLGSVGSRGGFSGVSPPWLAWISPDFKEALFIRGCRDVGRMRGRGTRVSSVGALPWRRGLLHIPTGGDLLHSPAASSLSQSGLRATVNTGSCCLVYFSFVVCVLFRIQRDGFSHDAAFHIRTLGILM